MVLTINKEKVVTDVATVGALAQELGLPKHGVAVAINRCIIWHEMWDETTVHEVDDVTIIKAAYGG